MGRDYKSFSSAAKSRFRGMSNELGYEQLSGILYVKLRDGWFEGFSLQASSYGNDFFYINYGIIIPNLWPPFDRDVNLKTEGYCISRRLYHGHDQSFSNASKSEIENSASTALACYKSQARPWFDGFSGLESIAEAYFETTHLQKSGLGHHNYEDQLSAANYGLLLRHAGKMGEAIKWLREAERIMAMPVYFTRDDRVVYEKEKHARLLKPDQESIIQHDSLKKLIGEMA